MCYYITIAISKNQANHIQSLIPRGISVKPVTNRSIKQHLPKEFVTYIITCGMCSCSLFSEEPEKEEPKNHIKKLRRKYANKGWSQAKIERAISQHFSDKRAEPYGMEQDVRTFLAEISDQTRKLFVVVHWYGGYIESERIMLREGPKISSDQLRTENPITKTDRLYMVVGISNG
jgi:hypothetical protein